MKAESKRFGIRAFSLVELLVVIAVIAIIAGIAIPQFTGVRDAAFAARDATRQEERARFVNNIRGLGGPSLDPNAITNGQSVSVTNFTNVITFTYSE